MGRLEFLLPSLMWSTEAGLDTTGVLLSKLNSGGGSSVASLAMLSTSASLGANETGLIKGDVMGDSGTACGDVRALSICSGWYMFDFNLGEVKMSF